MLYRRFGKTGLELSVLSMGGMRFTDGPPELVLEIMQSAYDAGINHFETARGYGDSEKLMGWAFANGFDRSKIILTTKIGPRETYDDFMKTLDTCLTTLGVDYLDNLDVHGINNLETFGRAMDEKGNWRGVRKAMDDGRVRHIGFSTHGPREVLMETVNTEAFESINLHYYYFFQRHAEVVARAAELDMGVFIISPNDKGGMLFQPSAKLADLCRPLTPMQFNARWLLSQPQVTTLSLGMARPGDVEELLTVVDNDQPLDEIEREILARLDAQWRSEPLGDDYCAQCYDCLPCPEDILIPEALRLRNMGVAFDMEDYARYRYKMFTNGGHWFPGNLASACTECGQCIPRCPEDLDIPRLLFDAHDRYAGQPGQRMWD